MTEDMIIRATEPDDGDRVDALLDAAARAEGHEALSDHLRLDRARGEHDGFAAVVALDRDGALAAYAQASRGNDAWELGVVVDPSLADRRDGLSRDVLEAALDIARAKGGGAVHWWVARPRGGEASVAAAVGLAPGRELHQLRRLLPTGLPVTVATRSFVVGRDEDAWLAVNNRAFAGHPEQGGWDRATLAAREAEPWFDPDGFRLFEEDGRVLGFCWTKVHDDETPALGEIYVIAVDPDAHGRGLGRGLTLAGLESLAARGITVGMLYVDASNTAAMALYASLGFTTHHVQVAYVAKL